MSMTIKQAIHVLHLPGDHIRDYDEYGYGVDDELKDAMQMALDALRKREPVPAVKKKAMNRIYLYFCPSCGKLLNEFVAKPKFCNECGQAIKWEEKKWE